MMRKFSKRLLTGVLAVAMVFGLSGMATFAAEADQDPAEPGMEEEFPEEQPGYPESDHNYANNADEWWTYTLDGAEKGVYVTFDSQTRVETNWDYIYVYDGDDNLIGQYTGTTLAGATLYIPTDTFKINLTSDSSTTYWGFAVTNVEAVEGPVDLSTYATVSDPLAPVYVNDTPSADVMINGTIALEQGVDFTVAAETGTAGETVEVTITGIGDYTGTLTTHVFVYDESHLAEGAAISPDQYIQLRQTRDSSMGEAFGVSYIPFTDLTDAYVSSITSITMNPVETDAPLDEGGVITGDTNPEGVGYPYAAAPVTITPDSDRYGYVSGNSLYFNRSESDPVVYVAAGHGYPHYYTQYGTEKEYPQTQVYEITVEATGYEDTVGTVTYCTGTCSTFSIVVVDEDGTETVAGEWDSDELAARATFANGSSQCGMTGFRTFTSKGISLSELLEECEVDVSADDYFLLDTTDHYGNYFTYKELFGTPRYFMEGIYTEEFADLYHSLGIDDADAGYNHDIRLYLGKYAWEHRDTTLVEPRIASEYNENMIYGTDLGNIEVPTEENTTFDSLVSLENRFRFIYGVALVQEDCNVTFDTQGGSEVESQTVLSHHMSSTELTTMWTSYWATSLVIYRGQGKDHPDTDPPLTGTDTIAVPDDPTKDGYIFAGWYTDEECTKGNEFDFTANDGTVDEDTTLYAKWEDPADIDKTDLEAAIETANALNAEDYTEESWSDLEAALAAAQDVFDNPNASQEVVDQATDDLVTAIENLKEPGEEVDKDALEEAIAEVEALDPEDYTEESWSAVDAALAVAQDVVDNPDATQDEVNDALLALQTAKDNLEPVSPPGPEPTPSVDRKALEDVIDTADNLDESKYTPESWAAMQIVLTMAKTVDADEDATQDDVDDAAIALITAIAELEPAEEPGTDVDKSNLLNEVSADLLLTEDSYTPDSWEPFETALASAVNVLADPDATQDEVNEALLELQTAKDNLEPVTPEVKNGLIKDDDGVWRLYDNGVFLKDYTGFASNDNGKWYVERGIVSFDVTDILKDKNGLIGDAGTWYYVIDSKVQEGFTGLSNFSNTYGWWYIEKGKVDFTKNSVEKNCNGWWYVEGGKVQLNFTGLANYKNDYGWWYIQNGAVDFTHNGVDKNKNGWWYVNDGKVNFDFTGLANYQNDHGWWYIESGKVNFNHTGVEKNKNGWWYVKDSKVDFGFTGVASNQYGTWYIVNGKVAFSYSGTVTIDGTTYTVRDGKVS